MRKSLLLVLLTGCQADLVILPKSQLSDDTVYAPPPMEYSFEVVEITPTPRQLFIDQFLDMGYTRIEAEAAAERMLKVK